MVPASILIVSLEQLLTSKCSYPGAGHLEEADVSPYLLSGGKVTALLKSEHGMPPAAFLSPLPRGWH